jgi:hypothetical protein
MSVVLMAAAAIVPHGVAFDCTPTRVWDGDGPVWCAEGPRLRISGIAAREIDGNCRTNQPCPSIDPLTSRDALVELVGVPYGRSPEGHILVRGPTMQCVSEGSAGGKGRPRGAFRHAVVTFHVL